MIPNRVQAHQLVWLHRPKATPAQLEEARARLAEIDHLIEVLHPRPPTYTEAMLAVSAVLPQDPEPGFWQRQLASVKRLLCLSGD